MSNLNEITAADLEYSFGVAAESGRFASLCNALMAAKAASAAVGYPAISEKPGADGSFDGEWTLSSDAGTVGGLAIPGWNVFQFKARSITGQTRSQVITKLKSSLRGAAIELTKRVRTESKTPSHYVLFTNLQLGLATSTGTAAGGALSKDREELADQIREGAPADLEVTIIDAGNLAAEINANAALKLTYFAPWIATTWEEKWNAECATSGHESLIPLIGRDDVLKEFSSWLADDAVRVIALDGANGMGKTRLALEATRFHRSRTTVVEAADDFERVPLAALSVARVPRILILEDPDAEQAKRITKSVMAQPRLKLIITLPTRDKAPWFFAGEAGVKYYSLQPLERDPSAKLLKAANPNVDGNVAEWILQNAGGIPFVILNAAHYGNELRDNVGTLKQILAQKFVARIEKEIGPEGVEALRLISPLQWTHVVGERSELSMLAEIFRPNLAVPRILDLINRLVRMGFARRRGNYGTVTPPIFASALAENVFSAVPSAVRALFDQATDDGRRRLLERAVILELDDVETFWTHVFEFCGANAARVFTNASMFHALARANPVATARCLERNVAELVRANSGYANSSSIAQLTEATRELVHHDRTSAAGMRIMEALAIGFPDCSADEHFQDAFVHWFYSFPLPYSERLEWLKRLLESTSTSERQLGAKALERATSIPNTMSGLEVTARRLGGGAVSRLWSEVHDYLEGIFNLRFQHLVDTDRNIANLMAKGLTNALTRLAGILPPERMMKVLSAFMQLYRCGAVSAAPVDVRRLLEFTSSSYGEKQKRAVEQHQPRWDAPLAQLEVWRKEFDDGPFALRFRLAIARVHDWKEVEFEGLRMSANEMVARQLAREVVAAPALMSEDLWQLSESPDAWTFHSFVSALCEYDSERRLLPLLETRAQRSFGERNLAIYLEALNRIDSKVARARFDNLVPILPKSALLVIMDMFCHPPEHLLLLKKWIAEKRITPEALGTSLSRRSLNEVSPDELAAILEYVASGPNIDQVMHILSGYVYGNKPLPRDLFPLAIRLLKSIRCSNNLHYECSAVAVAITSSDKDTGFALFRDQVISVHTAVTYSPDDLWDPLGRLNSNQFWEHLVATWPEDAYRALLGLTCIDFNEVSGPLLNLRKHRDVLLRLCNDVVAARFFAARLGGMQEGFFEFASAILSIHPSDPEVRKALVIAALSEGFDQSFSADHFRQTVIRLEARLKDSATPVQDRSWLESARARALELQNEEERTWASFDQRPSWEL